MILLLRFLLLTGLGLLLAAQAHAAAVIARTGDVRVCVAPGSPWLPLNDSAALSPGAQLRTGDSSSVTLRLLSRSAVTLGPRSYGRFDGERFRAVQLTVFEGMAQSRVERLDGQRYRVATATAWLGVRGTDFTVQVSPEGLLTVSVDTGLVAAGNAADSTLIAAGEVLAADPFAGLQPVTPAAAADLDAWRTLQQQLLRDNPDSVTEKFRPFVWRELAQIRVMFDDIDALYKYRAQLAAQEMPPGMDAAAWQQHNDTLVCERAISVYERVLEGRARMDAVQYTVHRLQELYGPPAGWIDDALVSYRGIWDGWLTMLEPMLQENSGTQY